MLANILHSLANDDSDSGGVAQLLVTALGSSGQHYICWKTVSGEFRQRSNGLPKELQEWLFPADGSTRDFETLQVILSGADSFWASDRNGELRSEPSSFQQQHRRALTFGGENISPTSKRRASRARELAAGETERPRSSTLPSSKSPTVDHLPGPHLKPPASHSRSSSADKLRRISLVSMAFNQPRRSWATRPRSIVSGAEDLGVLKEQPSPRRPELPTRARTSTSPPATVAEDRCTCGHHDNSSASSYKQNPKTNIPTRTGYADASVQTDPTPIPEPETTSYDFSHRRHKHHYRRESSTSTASTADSSYHSSNSSKRSSFETTTTRPDSQCFSDSGWEHQQKQQQQQWRQSNPVIMGRMQDYFRSSNYTLGAALQS